MTKYLTLDEALRIHEVLIESFGGAAGVRDMGLIELALLRPQTGYYADLIEEAAALWESLAHNRPFVVRNQSGGCGCTGGPISSYTAPLRLTDPGQYRKLDR